MQRVVHQPEVQRCHDGRWVVRCPECQRIEATETLVGIGTPVQSEHEARLMNDNHDARRGGAPAFQRRSPAQANGGSL